LYQKDNVNVRLFPATAGVLLKLAESAELNLRLRDICKPPAAAAVDASNSGLALPGMLIVYPRNHCHYY